MKVTSATFMRGIVGDDEILRDKMPQIAFIGRSNVGKSSLINAITGVKGLSRSSSTPGRTREINFFLINKRYYLVDLPGYGYASGSADAKEFIWKLITSYIFDTISKNRPEQMTPENMPRKKIVVIIDAKVGPTKDDLTVIDALEKKGTDFIIAANKVDKLNANEYRKSMINIEELLGHHTIVPCSTTKHIGIKELSALCFS